MRNRIKTTSTQMVSYKGVTEWAIKRELGSIMSLFLQRFFVRVLYSQEFAIIE